MSDLGSRDDDPGRDGTKQAGGSPELRLLSREVLYTGKVFDLIVDRVQYPSGNTGIREIARHPGGAVIVPLLDDGRVILVRQLRYPLGKHIIELPAGKLAPGEDPGDAAARELEEETGWIAGSLEHLATIYTTPGFCDEELHLYLAAHLRPSPHGHRREEGESTMTLQTIPLRDALGLVERGEVRDAKTIIGLMLAAKRLEGKG
jgi:ADP-ribose pyrophosphatase